MRSLGADHVIDYTREDFTQSDPRTPAEPPSERCSGCTPGGFGSTCNPIPDANPANSTTRSRLRLTKPRRGRHTADHLQRLNPPDGYADDCPESRVPQDAFPCETSTEADLPAVLPEPIPRACCYSQMLSRGTFGPSLGATRRLAWRSVAQPRIRSGTRDPSATFRVWGDAQIRLRPGEGRPR